MYYDNGDPPVGTRGCIIENNDISETREICFGESPAGNTSGQDYTLAEHIGKIVFLELQDGG